MTSKDYSKFRIKERTFLRLMRSSDEESNRAPELPTIALIGIPRSGTSCLSRTIAATIGRLVISEPFGIWGLTTNRVHIPFGKLLNQGCNKEYFESVLSSVPCIKHSHILNRCELPSNDLRSAMCGGTERMACERDVVVFITRRNFLDLLVSWFLANKERNHGGCSGNAKIHGSDYSGGVKIPRNRFNAILRKWREWHNKTLPRLIEMRKAAGKPYHVIDYEQIADPVALKAFVLTHIPGASAERFRIPTKKQKIRTNEEYITNYEEVKEWFDLTPEMKLASAKVMAPEEIETKIS